MCLPFYHFCLTDLDVFMQQNFLKEGKEHYAPLTSLEEIFLHGHL